VSVVLVNWNGRALLDDCLASVRDGADGLATETLLTDNGSSDGSAEHVRSAWPGVRMIENAENRGFGTGNNQAIRLARGDKVLLLNTDARLAPGTLGALARFPDFHRAPAAVTPALAGADGKPQNAFDNFPRLSTELLNKHLLRRLFPSRFPSKERAAAGPLEVESAIGACLLLRRRALDEVGGFDEGYFLFLEETDLCLRLHRRGWRIWFLPSVRAVHLGGGSKARARAEAWIEYYRSLYRYFRKNRSRAAYLCLRVGRFGKLLLNLAGSALLLAATLGFHRDSARRLPVYARLLGWHLRFCPDSAGLRPEGRKS
jgi:hypothetical protein